MKNIEEQFRQLTEEINNPNEIRKLIGQSEDLYLECKTISEREIDDNLICNKQSVVFFNYGKSISAFANAEGGVVIWGLFAKEKDKHSPDLIQEERPIKKITKVKTDFDSIIGKVVSRRVVGVQNSIVYTDKEEDKGFIVTYIPKSDEVPHRVEGEKSTSRRYFRRHGNGSYEMEHYELEEMFNGRANPKLKFVITAYPETTRNKEIEAYNIKFGLINVGKTIAQYPSLEIIDSGGISTSLHGLDGNNNIGLTHPIGNRNKYQGGINHIIHINDILWVDQFISYVDDHFEKKGKIHNMIINIACDRFRMRTFKPSFDLRKAIDNIIEFDYEE